MEQLTFTYAAQASVARRVHIGVVGSGDLEVLLEPSVDGQAHVTVTTSVSGYAAVWKNVLDRFFTRFSGAAAIEINDFGATPGVVMLRLEQAAEAARA
ncbi:MAG TPA: malonate decarboxylase subunit delta [Steroidobacteraceae bacterium]|jgi:malonate decarboxylase delta subunit|nr:malonate decarboxylase subunit delta [Steroidobacteraceae bacterium]